MEDGPAVGSGVDGFSVRARYHPQAPVLLIGPVERHPRADQCVGQRWNVIGVLMPALAAHAWWVEEHHRLQCEHIRSDQRLQHIYDGRIEKVLLGDRMVAVDHMDAREARVAFSLCALEMQRPRARRVDPAVKHVVGIAFQLLNYITRGKSTHYDEAITLIIDVLRHFDPITFGAAADLRIVHGRSIPPLR
ncbi:MAG: hypothetical protein MUC51_11840 [Anaerolineae bacterium]|nr:hypothetical protein [Anaerolineae bacterium]